MTLYRFLCSLIILNVTLLHPHSTPTLFLGIEPRASQGTSPSTELHPQPEMLTFFFALLYYHLFQEGMGKCIFLNSLLSFLFTRCCHQIPPSPRTAVGLQGKRINSLFFITCDLQKSVPLYVIAFALFSDTFKK